MAQVCNQNAYVVNMMIHTIMHIAMLFLILGLFFKYYVSDVMKSAMEGELEHAIKGGIETEIAKYGYKGQYNDNTVISKLHSHYDRPHDVVEMNNRWLYRDMFTVSALLFACLIVIIVTSYLLCHPVNLGHVVLENLLVFVGIGAIELLFFNLVVSRYVPIPPSLMMNTVKERLTQIL